MVYAEVGGAVGACVGDLDVVAWHFGGVLLWRLEQMRCDVVLVG